MPFTSADEEALLATLPDTLFIGGMFKATTVEQDGERIIYMQASNESVDYQNEKVLTEALAESASYYERYGNVDIDHVTQIGAKQGIPNYMAYEIGRPIEVKISGRQTFVKAQLYRGDVPIAEKANMVWDSMANVTPPARWYPSVGGAISQKDIEIDPDTKAKIAVIKQVRWTNIGLSRTPVNLNVPTAATVPFGVLSKCWMPGGLNLAKALEAGYGTDSAALIGGGALRTQSLHGGPHQYFDLKEKLAGALRGEKVGKNPNARSMVQYCTDTFGLSLDEAAENVERFMRDLKQGLNRRK